jgi:hypothetical protein
MKYGVQVSANLSTADIAAGNFSKLSKDINTLAGATVVAEYGLTNSISVRTSLGLLQKGVELSSLTSGSEGGPTSKSSLATTLNYLEMPWNLTYNIPVKSARIMIGAGPSFGVGISGKAKATLTGTGVPGGETKSEADAFKDEDKGGLGLKRFDASANALVGLSLKNGLYFTASYLYGLSDISSDDEQYKNRGLQLGLGIMFKKKSGVNYGALKGI